MRTVLLVALALSPFLAFAEASHVSSCAAATVCVKGYAAVTRGWDPEVVHLRVGQTVSWTTGDGLNHPVGLVGGGFHQGNPQVFEARSPGVVEFHCLVHSTMRGVIVVTT